MNNERTPRARRASSRTTMTDVAQEAGVSQTTVSLVLNDVETARVSMETRAKVRLAAEALGYRGARRERGYGSEPGLIGVVVDDIASDPWTAMAVEGARRRAWERGYFTAVAVSGGDPELERATLAHWAGQSFAGVILGVINTREVPMPARPAPLPMILLNCYVADRSLPSIVPGEIAGGHAATERLIRAGHRRIAFIGGEPWMDASRDRLKGYRQALATWDLPYDADLVREGDWQPSSGYALTRDLLAIDRPPTAIFCGNDLMAMGCFDALKEAGRAIPGHVAVIGYDDRDIARHLHPPLTTVLLPHHEMGAMAADFLLDAGFRAPGRPPQIKLECPLVERASV